MGFGLQAKSHFFYTLSAKIYMLSPAFSRLPMQSSYNSGQYHQYNPPVFQ